MADGKAQIYRWEGIHWSIEYGGNLRRANAVARCPKQNCNSRLEEYDDFRGSDYKYRCTYCDYEISLKKSTNVLGQHLLEKQKYKEADIINLDGELIRIQRVEKKDNAYWIDVKMSKNKKGDLQLMVLAGSKKSKDKAQLFLDPANERLAFDQNNDHPTKIFSKVIAIFKNSSTSINEDS